MFETVRFFSKEGNYMRGDNPEYWSMFYEPDLNNQLTAVAFEPMEEKVGARLFSKFKLL